MQVLNELILQIIEDKTLPIYQKWSFIRECFSKVIDELPELGRFSELEDLLFADDAAKPDKLSAGVYDNDFSWVSGLNMILHRENDGPIQSQTASEFMLKVNQAHNGTAPGQNNEIRYLGINLSSGRKNYGRIDATCNGFGLIALVSGVDETIKENVAARISNIWRYVHMNYAALSNCSTAYYSLLSRSLSKDANAQEAFEKLSQASVGIKLIRDSVSPRHFEADDLESTIYLPAFEGWGVRVQYASLGTLSQEADASIANLSDIASKHQDQLLSTFLGCLIVLTVISVLQDFRTFLGPAIRDAFISIDALNLYRFVRDFFTASYFVLILMTIYYAAPIIYGHFRRNHKARRNRN